MREIVTGYKAALAVLDKFPCVYEVMPHGNLIAELANTATKDEATVGLQKAGYFVLPAGQDTILISQTAAKAVCV